jgi:hypothetical protein
METRVKHAHVLSHNQITEIVMDSESDEENYACEDIDKEQSGPSSQRSSITQPVSPDFSASSSEDEGNVGNLAGQQPQPCPLNPKSM